MDKTAFLSLDLEKGYRILKILDDAGMRVNVALWAVLADYEDWRLILSAREFDIADLTKAYGLLHEALDGAGFTVEETPPVVILRSSDPFIKALGKIFGKAKGVEGMRIYGQRLGNHFVEDGYTSRIS